jgi:hypothetical protein
MTQNELYNSIVSLKIEYLEANDIYLNKLSIGDSMSFKKQREYLIALDIYLQTLEYCYGAWDELEEIGITQSDISTTIGAAITCLRTFNPNYYG